MFNKPSKILTSLLTVTITLTLAACASGPATSRSSEGFDLNKEKETMATSVFNRQVSIEPEGQKNILFIGDDEWNEFKPGHSDLMCLLRLDFDNYTITEITIPRDVMWRFEDGTQGKLEYVYTNDGPEAQTRAASDIIGEEIDFYAVVNFEGFEKIVDFFGGVPVDLPYGIEYSFYTNDYPNQAFQAGQQTLNGWDAMVMSRARTGYEAYGINSTDAMRQYVNRMMLTSLIQAAYSNSAGIEGVLTKLQSDVKTNLPLHAQVSWAQKLASKGDILVRGTTGPFDGGISDKADGQWLVTPDEDGWRSLMKAVNSGGDLKQAIKDGYAMPEYPAGADIVTETTIKVK